MGPKDEAVRRANDYAASHGLTLHEELGAGVNGVVFFAERRALDLFSPRQAAVKACYSEPEFKRERNAYLRLQEHHIVTIRNCMVPQLVNFSDDLYVIEMTIVTRPFVLDFGGAYLDRAPEFSEEVMADWRAEKIEQFGENWPEAERILRELECLGIYVIDVHPGNIGFLKN